jgi:hypothetical protein
LIGATDRVTGCKMHVDRSNELLDASYERLIETTRLVGRRQCR